ncbi:plasmid mobilization protein [Actinomycetes bacterium M1A6_2h]
MTSRGRPPSANPADKVVSVRLTAAEHALVATAAAAAGVSISAYLRTKGVAAARRA